MDGELHALEERIRQAAGLMKQLRAENVELRQRVASLESENRRLGEKVESAALKVEALLARIAE